ncbi:MAG: ABC transporter ATP-binding protein [Roseburia sp.]|nr:ABC transporter ATP-binding protein [Roseburia sp.]MCM1243402.1 ABC transporter ATP-binding protein [Roseburia sp.]
MIPIVQCMGLSKTYGGKPALNQIYLNLERGRIIGLLGPNGSGKTTLIKIMNDLLKPSAGEILIDGERPGINTKYRISYLPERTYLHPGMKVMEMVQYFQDFYPDFRIEKAYDMLHRLQIPPDERLKNLSKGTKEKVQLILVMSREADLYVLDEPIAGVDPASRDYILHTIVSNYNRNASVLISTHLIADVESILDEVVFIKYGNIILQAPAEQIRQKEGKSVDRFFREVFAC